MVKQSIRENDDDKNAYRKRRAFDYKTLLVIGTALLGSGGITGIINALTNPDLQTQMEVEGLDLRVSSNEKTAIANSASITNRTQRVEEYIKSHEKEEELRQKMIDQEFEHIKTLLNEISTDVKTIKNSEK